MPSGVLSLALLFAPPPSETAPAPSEPISGPAPSLDSATRSEPVEAPVMVSPEGTASAPQAGAVEASRASATPEGEAESTRPAAEEVDHPWVVGGIVDAAYAFNSNRPNNHLYRGAFTTPRTGEFTIHVAGAFLEHRARPTGGWTMQLGLHAGSAVDAVYAPEPQPGGVDSAQAGVEVFKHIALANAGFRFRTGTDVGLGIFGSPVGIGGLWSTGNWLYSSSWESNWVPYYLSGLRLSQELPSDLRLEAWIVSGWQTISDVNEAPSGMLALYWTPSAGKAEGAWLAGHLYAGPETESLAVETWLTHGSLQAGYDEPRFGVSWVWDAGRGGMAADPGTPGLYTGGALFSRIRLLGRPQTRLDLNLRPELWWDPDGLTYGRPGMLLAMAGGLGLHAYDALIVRLEYRYDHSSAELGSFYSGRATNDAYALATDQHTVFLNVTAHYELAFGRRRHDTGVGAR